jgi:hypothetical protein
LLKKACSFLNLPLKLCFINKETLNLFWYKDPQSVSIFVKQNQTWKFLVCVSFFLF